MGVAIDFLVLLFLVWSLYRGWRQGFLYQLGQLAVVMLAYFVAKGLGGLIADPITGPDKLPPALAETIGFFAIFFIVTIIGAVLLKKVTKDLLSFSEGLGQADKVLGILLGGAKGALIAYIAIVGLIMAHRMTGKVPIPFGDSIAGRWVMQNNFLDSDDFPRGKALAKLAWLLTTRSQQELAADPHVQAIMANPKAQTLLTPQVLGALAHKDFVSLLGNEALWEFLDEPDVQEHLNAIEWTQAEAPDTAQPVLPPPADGPLHP
ncbi:MAG: CvpA family protein [Deltaproteobacteria bacterium]|nr:MAG: CvpA family protein [Deltaproteobacteria bacterium]